MLRHVLFDMELFATEADRETSQKRILFLLQALTNINRLYLRDHPDTPLIYRSGITYKVPAQFEQEDVPEVGTVVKFLKGAGAPSEVMAAMTALSRMCGGGEHFRDIPRIIENGGGDCFPLSQKIIVRSRSTGLYELLALGELRHVYPSYEALSYSFRDARYEFRPIIGFVDKGMRPVCRAHLSNGTDLVATADHKFWTVDGSGSNSRRLGVRAMGEYVEVMKASRGRRTARSRIIQAARIPALGTVKPSEASAYLAGIYAAEGNFDGKHTCIAQHKPKVRRKIEAALSAVGTGFRYRQGHGPTAGSGSYYALHGGSSNPIVAMMREQGLTSFDKCLPDAFLSGDERTLAQIVEGHGDGDAWRPASTAFRRPEIDAIYATSSERLVEQLRFALLILGRPTYNYRYESHQGIGSQPIWRLHEYGARSADSKLRKRRDLVEHDLGLEGLTYGTVLSAEAAGESHVGCIEVEENHNFFLADGTLVSNCDNVASWRAAELCERLNIFAQPYITWRKRPDGGTTYHVIVRYPDGSSEDPSLLLGMGGADREPDRQQEERKLGERVAEFIKVLTLKKGNVRGAVQEVLGGQTESGFGRGIQYTIPFQTDDSYEDWSPTRPSAFYADPRYPGMPTGPFINTRWRDADDVEDDFDDRMDGMPYGLKGKALISKLRRRAGGWR